MNHPTSEARIYYRVYAALLGLLALSIALSSVHLGHLGNLAVALAIASAKGALIFWYFMHARQTGRIIHLYALTGFVWLAIFLVLTVSDFWTRDWLPLSGGK
jgi:cytochrome c oxidase subunit 4